MPPGHCRAKMKQSWRRPERKPQSDARCANKSRAARSRNRSIKIVIRPMYFSDTTPWRLGQVLNKPRPAGRLYRSSRPAAKPLPMLASARISADIWYTSYVTPRQGPWRSTASPCASLSLRRSTAKTSRRVYRHQHAAVRKMRGTIDARHGRPI